MVRWHPEDQPAQVNLFHPWDWTHFLPLPHSVWPPRLHPNSPGLTLFPGHFPELKGFPSLFALVLSSHPLKGDDSQGLSGRESRNKFRAPLPSNIFACSLVFSGKKPFLGTSPSILSTCTLTAPGPGQVLGTQEPCPQGHPQGRSLAGAAGSGDFQREGSRYERCLGRPELHQRDQSRPCRRLPASVEQSTSGMGSWVQIQSPPLGDLGQTRWLEATSSS